MPKGIIVLLFIVIFSNAALAQKAAVEGLVKDTVENRILQNATVLLIRASDSVLIRTTQTNQRGKFKMSNILPGKYMLQVSFPKMADRFINVRLLDTSKVYFNTIHMELKSKVLDE